MTSSRGADDRRPGRTPGRRAWRAAWVLLALIGASCGTEGPSASPPASSPSTRLWSYEEVVERTDARIRAVAWPAGLTPTGTELIGPPDAGPPAYPPGFDESRVVYDRLCAWWVAWRQSRQAPGTAPATDLVAGLAAAATDYAALDLPGSPIAEQRRALERASGGDHGALDDPAFSDLCLVGVGRWWDARLPATEDSAGE